MYGLATIWLLVTVVGVHSNVSNHYFWKAGSQNNTCNWTVQVFCENSFVIDILDVTVSYISCTSASVCSPCTGSTVNGTSTIDTNTSIEQYIIKKCDNLSSCNTFLPYPGDINNKNMTHVTVHYICTDTDVDISTSKKINGTTADLSTSAPAFTKGDTENTTCSDTNTDTSTLTVTKVTTVGVDTSPPALTDIDTENTTGTEKQSSSFSSVNIVVAVVPTVLLLVAIILVTVVIIARRHAGINDAKVTTNKSDDSNQELSKNGTCANVMAPTYEQLLRQIDNTDYSYIIGSTSAALIQEIGTGEPQCVQGRMYVNVVETMYEELSGDRSDMTYSILQKNND